MNEINEKAEILKIFDHYSFYSRNSPNLVIDSSNFCDIISEIIEFYHPKKETELSRLIKIIYEVSGTDLSSDLSRAGNTPVYRSMFCKIAKDLKYRESEISRYIGIKNPAINLASKKFQDYFDTEKRLRENYAKVIEEIRK